MVLRHYLNSDWSISPGHTCQGHRLHFGVGQHFKDRQTKKYFKRRRNLHDKGPSDHKPNGCHQNCRPCPPPDNLFWCCEWFSNFLFFSKFVCLCVLVRVCLLSGYHSPFENHPTTPYREWLIVLTSLPAWWNLAQSSLKHKFHQDSTICF